MVENGAYATTAQTLVLDDDQTFTTNLSQALRSNAFSNRMLIAPRRLGQMAGEEVANFRSFLQTQDTKQVVEQGRSLALQGLGQPSILNMVTALRRTCLTGANETISPLFELAEQYTSALLEGYMQGREEEIFQEQERTRKAYFRTQS